MKRHYPAFIEKDEDSDFGIFFPDFPGCVSAGETIDHAIRMGTEALSLHVSGMAEDGDAIPEPTPFAALRPDPDLNVVGMVMIPVALPGRIVRINVTIDEELLKEIDAIAKNRSGFLADAARAELARRA